MAISSVPMNPKQMVCLCNHISAIEIRKILRTRPITLSDVQNFTSAGTSCGRCVREIEAIIEKHNKVTKKDPQLRIDFE
jgi:bacterioferritin-associated ferredoxin